MFYQEKVRKPFLSVLAGIIYVTAGIFAGFLAARIFFTNVIISEESMEPNLSKGDRVIILKHFKPIRGEIALIESPREDGRILLKRVIAAEDDAVEIKNKIIYINNKIFSPSWKIEKSDKRILPMEFTGRDNMPPVKLKRNQYFVLGDNFDFSFDSRNFGPVDAEKLAGKLFYHIKSK